MSVLKNIDKYLTELKPGYAKATMKSKGKAAKEAVGRSGDQNVKIMKQIKDSLAKSGMLTAKLDTKKGGMDTSFRNNIHKAIQDAIELINSQIGSG